MSCFELSTVFRDVVSAGIYSRLFKSNFPKIILQCCWCIFGRFFVFMIVFLLSINPLFLPTACVSHQNIRTEYSLILPGPPASMYCTPSGGNAAVARGKANLSILEKGAMDNATPATTNNTRMEKRIALECGKRKPEEVTPRPFRGLKMPSNQNWSFCFDLRDESAVNRRNLWVDSSPCAFVVLQIRELILDNCYSTTVVGLTDEFLNLEVLSLIKVGLTNLKSFPNLPNLRRVSKILLSLPHDFGSTTLT